MTLCRVFLFAFVVASTGCAFAADPNSSSAASSDSSSQSWSTNADSGQFVPWFRGVKSLNPLLKSDKSPYSLRRETSSAPGMATDNSCLKLRTYKVKRQERFSDNESAFRGYSTCQSASNYQVRSAVGEQTLQVPPQ